MAAFNYDDYGSSEESGTLAAALNWGGAILSLVLIAGLATWGWKLWVRDVTGVPVVRALEGPMRVAPEDPGGLASEYQGLTVNRIAEDKGEGTPSDQVVLAPAPATLDEEEDLAMADLPSALPAIEEERMPTLEVAPAPVLGDLDVDSVAFADDEAAAPAASADLVEEAEVAAAPAPEPAPSATDLAVAAALAEAGLAPEPAVLRLDAAAGVPSATPRPMMRPVNLQRVSLAVPTVTGEEIDPATIAPGTRLVQLGAFVSPEVARTEWDRTLAQFGDFMVGKSRVVMEAETGGRTFYRLRVLGFDDLPDARRFCAVLVSDGANCIPVVHE